MLLERHHSLSSLRRAKDLLNRAFGRGSIKDARHITPHPQNPLQSTSIAPSSSIDTLDAVSIGQFFTEVASTRLLIPGFRAMTAPNNSKSSFIQGLPVDGYLSFSITDCADKVGPSWIRPSSHGTFPVWFRLVLAKINDGSMQKAR